MSWEPRLLADESCAGREATPGPGLDGDVDVVLKMCGRSHRVHCVALDHSRDRGCGGDADALGVGLTGNHVGDLESGCSSIVIGESNRARRPVVTRVAGGAAEGRDRRLPDQRPRDDDRDWCRHQCDDLSVSPRGALMVRLLRMLGTRQGACIANHPPPVLWLRVPNVLDPWVAALPTDLARSTDWFARRDSAGLWAIYSENMETTLGSDLDGHLSTVTTKRSTSGTIWSDSSVAARGRRRRAEVRRQDVTRQHATRSHVRPSASIGVSPASRTPVSMAQLDAALHHVKHNHKGHAALAPSPS